MLLLTLVFMAQLHAQKRFYPSVKPLVNNNEPSISPPNMSFIETWFKTTAEKMFHTDLQMSNAPKGDASFFSLGIITRSMKRFEFYNSGFVLTFNENVENPDARINMRFSNKFPIFAYTPNFSLKDFDPNDNLNLFYLLQIVHNITDNQMLAFFLNLTVEAKKNETRGQRLIKDVNKVNQIKVDEKLLDPKDARLTDLCNAINKAMPEHHCLYPVYRAYIEAGTIEQTREKLRSFFRGINMESIGNTLNNKILPSGTVLILEKTVSVGLPLNHFNYTSDSLKTRPVSFALRDLKYNLDYNYGKNRYEFTVELYPHLDNNANETFQFEHQTYNIFERQHEIETITITGKQIEYIELLFFDKTLEVRMHTNTQDKNGIDGNYKTLNDIILKTD